jgi:two-component system cell cycle response regulator PopA
MDRGGALASRARILIVARDDALAGPLAEALDQLGWRTVTARGPYAALAALADLPIEAAIVDVVGGGSEALSLARRLKAACAPRRLPVMAIADNQTDLKEHAFDFTLATPANASQAAMRLETMVRTAVAEEEFNLRGETFAERGRRLDPPEQDPGPLRILAVGEPAPRFLTLSNALTASGADVVGAFTAYTAFDYLHERRFDAVVLWAGDAPLEALSIAAGMRRNTRLYHIPTVFYLREGAGVTTQEAYDKGLSVVVDVKTSELETARQVIELANAYRRQSAIRQALEKARSSGLMDAGTGLFTRELFANHLVRLAQASKMRNRPLSVCVLRLADRPEITVARAGGFLDRAIPQIGSMIGRLVRVEDTAARLGPEIFALALPATSLASARAAAERIAAVIGCTAFEAGEGRAPFVVQFEVGAAEIQVGESAVRALEIAANQAIGRKAG